MKANYLSGRRKLTQFDGGVGRLARLGDRFTDSNCQFGCRLTSTATGTEDNEDESDTTMLPSLTSTDTGVGRAGRLSEGVGSALEGLSGLADDEALGSASGTTTVSDLETEDVICADASSFFSTLPWTRSFFKSLLTVFSSENLSKLKETAIVICDLPGPGRRKLAQQALSPAQLDALAVSVDGRLVGLREGVGSALEMLSGLVGEEDLRSAAGAVLQDTEALQDNAPFIYRTVRYLAAYEFPRFLPLRFTGTRGKR